MHQTPDAVHRGVESVESASFRHIVFSYYIHTFSSGLIWGNACVV
jgi:hypothetical protein